MGKHEGRFLLHPVVKVCSLVALLLEEVSSVNQVLILVPSRLLTSSAAASFQTRPQFSLPLGTSFPGVYTYRV